MICQNVEQEGRKEEQDRESTSAYMFTILMH